MNQIIRIIKHTFAYAFARANANYKVDFKNNVLDLILKYAIIFLKQQKKARTRQQQQIRTFELITCTFIISDHCNISSSEIKKALSR